MADIVISEPMHDAAVAQLMGRYDVLYDKTLYNRAAALRSALVSARALIVRNLTPVWKGLITPASRLKVVAHLGIDMDNMRVPVRHCCATPDTGERNG